MTSTSSLSTLWLLPDGRVCARSRGRTDSPADGAHRLAASLHPAELAQIYRIFVNGTDGQRYCLEAMLAHTRSCRLTGKRASLSRSRRAALCRQYRAAIARLRAGLPAFDEGGEPVVEIPISFRAAADATRPGAKPCRGGLVRPGRHCLTEAERRA